MWSAQRASFYYACLSHTLSGTDLAYILGDSGARCVIGSKKTLALLEAASAEGSETPVFLVDPAAPDAPTLLDLAASFPGPPIPDECAGSDMLYSSGTTGRPKGIRKPFHPGQPIAADTPMTPLARGRFKMNEASVYLSPAPLYHAGPLRWAMPVHRMGGTVVVMEHFDAEQALDTIARHHVTVAQWVPTHFVRMLHLPEEQRLAFDHSSLQAVFHAAAPCPIAVKEAMIDWWGPIVHDIMAAPRIMA